MVPQEVLDLLAKLKGMTVDNGAFPGEAMQAAVHMKRLLDKYQLSIADVSERKLGEEVGRLELRHNWKNTPMDILQYAANISGAFGCRLVYSRGCFTFVGMASDAEVAKFYFEGTWQRVRKAGWASANSLGLERWEKNGYVSDFVIGASMALGERLRGDGNALQAGRGAMVLLKEEKVAEYMDKFWPDRKDKKAQMPKSELGLSEGWKHGKKMDIERGLENGKRDVLKQLS